MVIIFISIVYFPAFKSTVATTYIATFCTTDKSTELSAVKPANRTAIISTNQYAIAATIYAAFHPANSTAYM